MFARVRRVAATLWTAIRAAVMTAMMATVGSVSWIFASIAIAMSIAMPIAAFGSMMYISRVWAAANEIIMDYCLWTMILRVRTIGSTGGVADSMSQSVSGRVARTIAEMIALCVATCISHTIAGILTIVVSLSLARLIAL